MAKGWSFGALTDALKTPAFTEFGTDVGATMQVGTFGIGKPNIPATASLDLSSYKFVAGELLWVKRENISNLPSGLGTIANEVRITCLAVADNDVTLLVTDEGAHIFFAVRAATGGWTVSQAIQQGGVAGMLDNKVYVGWDGKKTLLQVDGTPMGALFYENNPPTAAQTGAYPKTGGRVEGEVWSEVVNNFRLVTANRGVFWRFDGNACYLMFTNNGDPRGGYNALRPLIADFATGKLSTGHDFTAGGVLYAGAGKCWMATDGNVYGSAWGGYLSNWVAGQIAARIGSNNNWINQSFVTGHRQASAQWSGKVGSGLQVPAGCVVIGARNNGSSDVADMGLLYAAEQICINGNWMTIGLV